MRKFSQICEEYATYHNKSLAGRELGAPTIALQVAVWS